MRLKLHSRHEPPGFEWTILKGLPMALLGSTLMLLVGCGTEQRPVESQLDVELADILATAPGRYAGVLPNRSDPSAMLYHTIEPVALPEHGDTVLMHVISQNGFDDPTPFQQKFYAFDLSPDRTQNQMTSIVLMRASRWRPGEQLDESKLIRFPSECAIVWSRDDRGLVARVQRGDCVYQSKALGGAIEPDMTYVVTAVSFGIQDLLYRSDGTLLTPDSGLIVSPRVEF